MQHLLDHTSQWILKLPELSSSWFSRLLPDLNGGNLHTFVITSNLYEWFFDQLSFNSRFGQVSVNLTHTGEKGWFYSDISQ